MLNAACIDATCRETIQNYCGPWLEEVVKSDNTTSKETAAVILAKLQASLDNPKEDMKEKMERDQRTSEGLASMFKDMLLKDDDTSKQSSIEGLAYASL